MAKTNQPTQRDMLTTLISNSTATLSVLNIIADRLCGETVPSQPVQMLTISKPAEPAKPKAKKQAKPAPSWPTGEVAKGFQWQYTRTSGKAKSTFLYTATQAGKIIKGGYTKVKL